ncbi:hypothetical protein IAU59_006430 [Kwoniella sp. CBS 9459]
MSNHYPHAEGSQHPHQQQQQQQQQHYQPQHQPQDVSEAGQRPRPPAIQLPQNPYNPQYSQAPQHGQYLQSPQEPQGYYPPPPPPNIFYAAEDQPPGPPLSMSFDPTGQARTGHEVPSVLMPQDGMPMSYVQQQHLQQQQQQQRRQQPPMIVSPYEHPMGVPLSSGSSHNDAIPEYFPPLQTPTGMVTGGSSHNPGMTEYFSTTVVPGPPHTGIAVGHPLPSPSTTWQSTIPQPLASSSSNIHSRSNTHATTGTSGTHSRAATGGGSGEKTHGSKTTRQQFTACGACRHRRVKCDLKDKQEAAEKIAEEENDRGVGPARGKPGGKSKKVSCTNCVERGLNCIDEFAPLKAAKQLRRGKRISEIEMLFGKSAANAAMVHQHNGEASDSSVSPIKGKEKEDGIPDLTKEFFESAFFRRFQVQRPVIDPQNFIGRYLANPVPTAAAMGPEGAILCHVLYAWAVSYGVDENGQLDIPEGGGPPLQAVNLFGPGDGEVQREADRQRRKEIMRHVVEIILKEIDECGLLRKPTWDGVRVLLMVLPLTDGIASPVERLAMYESAISQVFTLCSFTAMGYDGQPSATASVNGGTDDYNGQDLVSVRVRVYWYAFVHEGITTGLKGGRLHLDDEDLETMQDSIDHRSLVRESAAFRISSQFATAPINLALACRKINKALTGPAAKRRTGVNADLVKEAWEALERCWEDFDQLKYTAGSGPSYAQGDEVIRFADGWKIFLFEAQNVIRTNLEDRLAKLSAAQTSAFITDSNPSTPEAMHNDLVGVQHLLDIARSKCEVKTRQIMEIVRHHVGTRFFEWDASLVRDGTFYTAMLLARAGGSDEDIQICIQALNELRWAHAKAWERSADLRREWQERSNIVPASTNQPEDWDKVLSDLAKLSSQTRQRDQAGVSDAQSRSTGSSHSHHHHHQSQPHHQAHRQPQQFGGMHPQQQHQSQHDQQQHHHQHNHRNSDPIPSSGSPFTSPPEISPTFDPSTSMSMPLMRGYIPQTQPQPQQQNTVDGHGRTVVSQLEAVAEYDGSMGIDTKAGIVVDGEYPKWMEPRHHQQHHQHPAQHHLGNPPHMQQHHHHHHVQHPHPHQHQLHPNHLGLPPDGVIGPGMNHLDGSTDTTPMGNAAMEASSSYPLFAHHHLGPPPLDSGIPIDQHKRIFGGQTVGAGVVGQSTSGEGSFMLQQDGTHVFVPYNAR